MLIRIIFKFFEKHKYPGIAFIFFFLQSSRYVSNEQSYIKTTGLYNYFYFYLVCFTFSISYSVLPFHLVFQFFHLSFIFLLIFFLKSLSSVVEKLLYIHICIYNMHNIHIRKLMNVCLTENFMTFWLHLFDLVWIEC